MIVSVIEMPIRNQVVDCYDNAATAQQRQKRRINQSVVFHVVMHDGDWLQVRAIHVGESSKCKTNMIREYSSTDTGPASESVSLTSF